MVVTFPDSKIIFISLTVLLRPCLVNIANETNH